MKRLTMFLSLLCLTVALAIPANAADVTIDAPSGPEYGKATSSSQAPYPSLPADAESSSIPLLLLSPQSLMDGFVGTPYEPVATADRGERPNEDVSKNAALVPPTFGSPASYVLGAGEPLTPNLTGPIANGLGTVIEGGGASSLPPVAAGAPITSAAGVVNIASTGYTAVTSDLYYANGSLGTLKIPSLGVSAKVVQGTDSTALAKGIGHFEDISLWDGNCALAAHNRGSNSYFGEIHTLSVGDTITYTTKLGSRTYSVVSVQKVSETDSSMLAPTTDNRLTLYTCVKNQSAYRWCVQAVEVV